MAVILTGSACADRDSQTAKPSARVLSIDPGTARTLLFSELFAKVEIINLQKPGNPLIDEIKRVRQINDKLYIEASSELLVAKLDGTITAQISRRGAGPGEYQNFRDVYVDGKGNIEILSNKKIITVDEQNNLVKDERNEFVANAFTKWGDKYFLYYGNNVYQSPFALVAVNSTDKATLKSWLPGSPKLSKFLYVTTNNNFLVVNDTLVFMQSFCDTVYQITKELELQPRFVLNFGERGLTKEIMGKPYKDVRDFLESLRREEKYCFFYNHYIETATMLFFSFEYRAKRYQYFFNKLSGLAWLGNGYRADLGLGGLELPVNYAYHHNPQGYGEHGIFYVMEPSNLISAIDSLTTGLGAGDLAKFKATSLGKLSGELKPDGNPLLIYAEFKR